MANSKKKYLLIVIIILVLFVVLGAIYWLRGSRHPNEEAVGCRTPTPSLPVVEAVERALAKKRDTSAAARAAGSVTIPVHFHIITNASGSEGAISKEVLDLQIAALNAAFSGTAGPAADPGANTPFRFTLASFETIKDDTLFDMPFNEKSPSPQETNAMAKNVGDKSSLNIYTARLGAGVLGWARVPFRFPEMEEPVPGLDGVVLHYDTLPGGSSPFDQGDTATHEIGHWLGLLHVFAFGCKDPGDFVADTPFQATRASGCNPGHNTCISQPFNDPVRNFMNTTTDECMYLFTLGQSSRMDLFHLTFRT